MWGACIPYSMPVYPGDSARNRNRNRNRLLGVLDYDYDDRFAEHERENRSEGLLPYAHSCEPSPKKMDSGFLMN